MGTEQLAGVYLTQLGTSELEPWSELVVLSSIMTDLKKKKKAGIGWVIS